MPDILVRGLDAKVMAKLKARAKRHGRSLQSEAKLVLARGAGADAEQIAAMLDEWKQRFAGRKFTGSATMIRKDRQR